MRVFGRSPAFLRMRLQQNHGYSETVDGFGALPAHEGADRGPAGAFHEEPDREASRIARIGGTRGLDQLREENRAAWRELWRGRIQLLGASQRWQGYVEYPEDFSIESFQENLQILALAKQTIRSPYVRRELEKKAAKRLPSITYEA